MSLIQPKQLAGFDAALAEPAWFISFLTGDNANSGTVLGSPLKTFAGLVAKLGSNAPALTAASVTITVIDHDASDVIEFYPRLVDPFATLDFVPAATPVLQSGTFTAVRAIDTATNVPPGLTDAALPGGVWPLSTATVGRRIKITSGVASGAYCFAVKDEGAQIARCTNATVNGLTLLQPGIGDSYDVETLTDLWVGAVSLSPGDPPFQSVGFSDFCLRGDTVALNTASSFYFNRCIFNGSLSAIQSVQVRFYNNLIVTNDFSAYVLYSILIVRNGGALAVGADSKPIIVSVGGIIVDGAPTYGGSFISQACPFLFTAGGRGSQLGIGVFDAVPSLYNPLGHGILFGYTGPYDANGPGQWGSSSDAFGRVWGAGNAGYGMAFTPNSFLEYDAAAMRPTITGALGDWASAAAGSTQQSVGYNGGTLIAEGPFANTYANLAVASPTGFGGSAYDPRTGVRVAMVSQVFT